MPLIILLYYLPNRGRYLDKEVKIPFGMFVSHIRVPEFESQIHFRFQARVYTHSGMQEMKAQVIELYHTKETWVELQAHGLSQSQLQLLLTSRDSTHRWDICLSMLLFLCLLNTTKINFKKF